jgi:anaerobic magnesium-protoporphyrin IX monomethyl ester cyclase
MKILLLHPGIHYIREGIIKRNKIITDHTLPLGILYVGEILRQNNYEVHFLDHAVLDTPVEDLVKWIYKSEFDVVGYSVLTGSFLTAIEIAKRLKLLNDNIINIFGGIQATLCADKIIQKYNCVDYCVRGEGEYSFLELIQHLESNKKINEIKGITFKENDIVKSTVNRPLIKNLDELPIPDRKVLTKIHKYILGTTSSPLITSRGCVYNCRFCSCSILFNRTLRYRSIQNVIDELVYLEGDGFKEVTVADDCFTANTKRVLKLCEQLKKLNLDIHWHANSRTNLGNFNMFRQMAQAGCATISFGIESGVQRILDYYNKQTSVELAIKSVKTAKKAKIPNIAASLIIGAPTETFQEIIETVKFGLNLNLSSVQFQLLNITPGTSLFEEFITKGWLNESDSWETPVIAADVSPEVVRKELLEKIVEKACERFVTNPKRIMSDYFSSITSKYRSQVISTIPDIIRKMFRRR